MPGPNVTRAGHQESRYPPATGPAPGSDGFAEMVLVAVCTLAWHAARGLWWLARRYPIPVLAVAMVAVAQWRGVGGPVWVAIFALTVVAVVVRFACPGWWRRRVTEPRRRREVTRWFRGAWPVLCERVGLVVTERDRRTGTITESAPGLADLCWSASGSVLHAVVRLVPGQLVEDLGEAAERLGEAAGAHGCRITRTGPGTARLTLLFTDPLTEVVPPLPIPDSPAAVDLVGLPVGVVEDGTPWRLRLAGTHVLVAGVTGAGKGSLIWSLLRALAPAIKAGTVAVWAVDGKAGMELAPGRALFTRFASTIETGVDLLEDAAAVMTARAARMSGHARTHSPSVEEPLLVVLVDEVALLTAYQPDRKLRDRADRALATLATQGRAPGVVLVAALQDPRKEVLGLRNLFPTKIGMRLDEKTQVDMVLGDGARDAGALCDKIPDTLPGVAYVKLDGLREPARVRAGYLTDTDITDLAAHYPAPSAEQSAAAATGVEAPAGLDATGVDAS